MKHGSNNDSYQMQIRIHYEYYKEKKAGKTLHYHYIIVVTQLIKD